MITLLRRLYVEQEGQVFYLVAACLFVLIGMAALSIDIGYALHAQRELQATTDAAASAGGASMPNPNTTSVAGVVDQYSGSTALGALYNVHPDLNVTGVSTTFACVSDSSPNPYNFPPCATPVVTGSYPSCGPSGSAAVGCNAIKVVETATVPTFFAEIFGIHSITLTASSVASASGTATPYHIMLILDTTASMGQGTDTGCVSGSGSGYSPEQCAQLGVQTLLTNLAPCAQGQTCTQSGSTPVDQVGIMAFPGTCSQALTKQGACPSATTLTDTTPSMYASDDYSCPATDPPITSYNNNPAYLILPFQDNYQTKDSAGLYWSSDLVKTVGAGTNSCGMPTPGGEGTFYAGAIVAAQQYLEANHTSYIQDVMILLSDGDATADATQMGGSVQQTVNTSEIADMNGSLFSATSECTQAVQAADWAKGYKEPIDKFATEIYSVSYGSETSGCASELSGSSYNTPCLTMEGIASTPLSQYFFSVPQTIKGQASTVCAGAVSITQLSEVFSAISADLSSSRLIPPSFSTGTTWY